jgi:hypothetical protein
MGDVIHWYQAKQQGLTTLRFDFSIVVKAEDIGLLSILAGSMFLERPDPLSRIYTNLTSLKREHRQYIHLNGAPLLMTDIVNSQIVFSVAAISDYLSQVERSAAVEANLLKYRTLAVSGQFYEALAHKAGYELTDHNRSLFKKEFFRQVFFSRIRSKGGDVKKAFRKMYRPIAVLINRMKKEHYADFAVALQRMEAQFMIDEVLAALHSQGIMALTIHDSIVLHNHNDRRVAEMMIKELMFSRYGFAPKMKWE